MRLSRCVRVAVIVAVLVLLIATPAGAFPGDDVVSNIAERGMSYAFQQTSQGMVTWVLEGVAHFTNGIVNFLKTAARPEVDAVWFAGPESPYAAVRQIALSMLLLFTFLGLISGLIQGDVDGMVRRIAGGLPAALFGMVATTFVVAKLLDLTDAMSTAVLAHSGSDALAFLEGFQTVAVATAPAGFPALLLGFVAIISALLLWVELLIRSALIYFLVALSPLVFAATLWPSARGVLRRLVEMLLAAIFSKFVICVALAIGAAALGGAGTAAPSDAGVGDAAAMSLGALLSGTVLLALACWSPFLLMRMLPIVETAVVAQGISRSPMRGAQTAMSTASYTGSVSRLAGGGASQAMSATKQSVSNSSRLSGTQSPTFKREMQEK